MLGTEISTKRLAQLCYRTGTSLKAGVDARRIWTQEAERGSSQSQRQRMDEIRRRLSNGDTLAEAMRDSNGYFPSLACEMVAVGEETGRLDDVLLQLAKHYNHMLSLRKQFVQTIMWPSIQLFAAINVVGFFILILGMIPGGQVVAPLGLYGSTGAAIYYSVIAVFAVMLTVAILGTIRGWFGPLPMMIALRVPQLGKCIKTMALARLCGSLAMALDAGVDARRSMRLALRSTQNPYYMSRMKTVDDELLKGREFNEALNATHVFPEDFIHSLATAELAGTYSDSLYMLAEQYQREAEESSKLLTTLASYAIWALVILLMVVMVGALIMSVFGSYYGEVNNLLDEINGR